MAERAFLEQKVFIAFQKEVDNGVDVINRRLTGKQANPDNCRQGFQIRTSLSTADLGPLRRMIADFLGKELSLSHIQNIPFEEALTRRN